VSLRAKLLSKFADWALSKNPPGGYAGEDDKRWAYTIVGEDGSPYLTRVLLSRLLPIKKLLGVGVYLHHFHRSDGDQELHNHPWSWGASLVLAGAYVEERVEQIVSRHLPCNGPGCDLKAWEHSVRDVLTDTKVVRWWNYLTKDDYHSVRELRGDVWTLFFTGERIQDWGFLRDGQHVPWRVFLSGLDIAAGDALDKIGKKYGVQRTARVRLNPSAWDGLAFTRATYDWCEDDSNYRERIRAAMRTQAAEELK
jgi:hypothetical protein